MSISTSPGPVGRGMNSLSAKARLWYGLKVVGPVGSRSGLLARRLRWPLPWQAPFLRGHLALSRPAGLGDVLMCTPTLRRIKQVNPSCRIVFYTKFGSLLEGLPYIDEIRDFDERPADAIPLSYTESIPPNSSPPRRHLAKIMADCVGLKLDDVRPDCSLDLGLVREYAQAWQELPRPYIAVNRHSSSWTPNREWPEVYWEELIARIARKGTVIEIGSGHAGQAGDPQGNYVNLVDRTSLSQLVAVIAAADLLVSPDSGPVHIAAAVSTPSVIIYGGYISPICTDYHGNSNIYTKLHCSPCWLTEPCPYNKECLRRIKPRSVEEAIARTWAGSKGAKSLGLS